MEMPGDGPGIISHRQSQSQGIICGMATERTDSGGGATWLGLDRESYTNKCI